MYISRVVIRNVRGFTGTREVDLDLTRPDGTYAGWTVLAGRNGSGKTSLLRAIGLTIGGPFAFQSLMPDREHFRTRGVTSAEIAIDIARIDGSRERLVLEDNGAHNTWESPSGDLWGAESSGNYQGRLVVGYGPLRRLVGGSNGAQRLAASPGQAGRLATLFHEEASLAEGITWLIDQHLRSLEDKAGAPQIKQIALDVLRDGLLPDGYEIHKVDSDGLWVTRGGELFPLREMSDGFRSVAALVLDLLHHIHAVFGYLEVDDSDGRTALVAPGVVLIDEVDAHLHVSWQRRIGQWLTAHFPNIQFLVTTHSPYICQSADPGGLIRLPGPDENAAPHIIGQDLHDRIIYGSGDDAVLSELFGIESLYSDRANDLRDELIELELLVSEGLASPEQIQRFNVISRRLTSSPVTRVAEVAAMLQRRDSRTE